MEQSRMDITGFSVETLLFAAMKSEIESEEVYSSLAHRVKNAILADRLRFLAGEEDKHRTILESIFRHQYPGKSVELPPETPVPLPQLSITDELAPLTDIFKRAMEAEQAARHFYSSLSERMESDALRETLRYLSEMEMSHYQILDMERSHLERFEEMDEHIPFIHEGP